MLRRLVALALVLPLPVAAQAAGGGTPASASGPAAYEAPEPRRPMVVVPAGRYTPLYSPDTAAVRVESFRMDRFPVTRADFAAFAAANPKWRRSQVKPVFADSRYLADWSDDLTPGGEPGSPNQESRTRTPNPEPR